MKNHRLKYIRPINEDLTEFNLQRLNPSNFSEPISNVDDRQLSLNAYDRYRSDIDNAVSRINDIMFGMTGNRLSNAIISYKDLGLMTEQNITKLIIKRIEKDSALFYNVYVSFVVQDTLYWGIVYNILDYHPIFKSIVFKDTDLIQVEDWKVKISGQIIRNIKRWLVVKNGMYKYINTKQYTIFSKICSDRHILKENDIITVIKSYENKTIIKIDDVIYELKGDLYIYFKWWFE